MFKWIKRGVAAALMAVAFGAIAQSIVNLSLINHNVITVNQGSASTFGTINTSRRYFQIQNNDASAIIYVTMNGVAATTSNSIKIPAGSTFSLGAPYAWSGQFSAIASATSSAIVWSEGQ